MPIQSLRSDNNSDTSQQFYWNPNKKPKQKKNIGWFNGVWLKKKNWMAINYSKTSEKTLKYKFKKQNSPIKVCNKFAIMVVGLYTFFSACVKFYCFRLLRSLDSSHYSRSFLSIYAISVCLCFCFISFFLFSKLKKHNWLNIWLDLNN